MDIQSDEHLNEVMKSIYFIHNFEVSSPGIYRYNYESIYKSWFGCCGTGSFIVGIVSFFQPETQPYWPWFLLLLIAGIGIIYTFFAHNTTYIINKNMESIEEFRGFKGKEKLRKICDFKDINCLYIKNRAKTYRSSNEHSHPETFYFYKFCIKLQSGKIIELFPELKESYPYDLENILSCPEEKASYSAKFASVLSYMTGRNDFELV